MVKVCSPLVSVQLVSSSREVALSYLIVRVYLIIVMEMMMIMMMTVSCRELFEKASADDQGDEVDEEHDDDDLHLLPLRDVPRSDENKSRARKAFCHVGLAAENNNHHLGEYYKDCLHWNHI